MDERKIRACAIENNSCARDFLFGEILNRLENSEENDKDIFRRLNAAENFISEQKTINRGVEKRCDKKEQKIDVIYGELLPALDSRMAMAKGVVITLTALGSLIGSLAMYILTKVVGM